MLSLPLTPFSSLPSYSSTQATLHYTTLHCTNHTIFSTGMKGGIPVFIEKLHSAFPLFHQKVFGSFSTAHPKIDKKKDVLVSWISNAALQPGGVYLTLPYHTIPSLMYFSSLKIFFLLLRAFLCQVFTPLATAYTPCMIYSHLLLLLFSCFYMYSYSHPH